MAVSTYKELIEKNPGVEFVIHTQNEAELREMVDTLEELGFEYALPFLGSIRELAEQFSEEDGVDGCWRISRDRGVAYNASVEHWRFYIKDIVEKRNGVIIFNDGDYDKSAAAIEKKKLHFQFFQDEDKEYARQLFGFADSSDDEIKKWLEEKFP